MGFFKGKPARAATNAPRDWPEVAIPSWSVENPIELYLRVAAELKRGFEAEGRDVDFVFGRSRLYEDGVVEVTLELKDGEKRYAVFVYPDDEEDAAAHYSGVRALLREREGVNAVYYAREPIQPIRPKAVLERIETNFFSIPEDEAREGEYALWWPTPEEPRFAGSKAAERLTRAFTALDGYQSFAFSAFVYGLGLSEPKENTLVALPTEPLNQAVDGPGELRLQMYASEERGLWFAFDRERTSPRDRDVFLKLFADFAEWFRGELEGTPPREEDQRALRWWSATRDQAIRREAEGEADLVVGRITQTADGGGQTEVVSTAQIREGAPSERLTTLVFDALDHAVEIVQETEGGDGQPALHAFLWLRQGEQTYSTTFVMADEPAAVKACRKAAQKWPDADHGVLVCDGYLREGEKRTDALMAHAYERGASQGHVFALKYVPPTKDAPFRVLGDAVLFAREAPLFE